LIRQPPGGCSEVSDRLYCSFDPQTSSPFERAVNVENLVILNAGVSLAGVQ